MQKRALSGFSAPQFGQVLPSIDFRIRRSDAICR
jgi:hypothetical protein